MTIAVLPDTENDVAVDAVDVAMVESGIIVEGSSVQLVEDTDTGDVYNNCLNP